MISENKNSWSEEFTFAMIDDRAPTMRPHSRGHGALHTSSRLIISPEKDALSWAQRDWITASGHTVHKWGQGVKINGQAYVTSSQPVLILQGLCPHSLRPSGGSQSPPSLVIRHHMSHLSHMTLRMAWPGFPLPWDNLLLREQMSSLHTGHSELTQMPAHHPPGFFSSRHLGLLYHLRQKHSKVTPTALALGSG